MKKLLLSAVAATLVVSPILAAAPASAAQWNGHGSSHATRDNRQPANRAAYRPQQRVTYRQNYQPTYRAWNRGDRFDSRYASNYRVIDNYRDYQLQAPPYGYQWEQSDNDAVLVALTSGLIGAVIGNAIR
jgi:Ni/Co efflux regulator RcnB